MDFYTLFKLTLLVMAIWFWTVNIGKMARGHRVPWANLCLAPMALVGFIYMQGWLS